MITSEALTVVEGGAPVGPDETEETAFLAEQRATSPTPKSNVVPGESEERNIPLPPMDDLIQRIPAATREVMDHLFRAKFITVKRMPATAFKTQI